MSTSCVSHPRLSNGEKSPLFSRLKNFLGDRKSAEDVYYRVINPSFREVFPNVRFDHNGEPLLEDLITQCGIGHNKSNEAMLDYLNSEYGTEPVPKTMQSAIELQNRAASFNINNPLNKKYSAEITSSGHDVSMEIVTATGNGRDLGKQQRFNAELNNQLVKLLNSWGADVAALTELEEASNINGVMDLSAGINAATGLKEVIRISKRHRWSNVSAKQNVLSEEEQEILNNAPRDSQGRLLAPNGKISNLTEKQYAQVRTKAFKRWFGDWENDPANASKVVDENGEPLVVYHGSKSILNVFDPSKSESRQYLSQQIKPTNFFSSDKTVADSFALTENQSLASQISKSISIVLDAFAGENVDGDILDDEIWTDAARRTGKSKEFVKDFWENKVPREYKMHDDFGTTRMEDPDINKYKYNVFLNMKSPIILDAKGERADRFIEANKEVLNNNDEVIIINIDETVGKKDTATDYLVRNSNQIKSATDNIGTFSRTDDNIIDDTYDSNILAEEWGHFVVDAVKDSPLRDRMLNSLKNEEVLQRVLGSEYDRYNEVYKGDIDLMAKEALGKMMAQVLNNYDAKAPNDRLFERYKKNVLDFFSRRDADEIDEIINKVREQVYEFTTNAFNGKYQLDISSRDYNKRLFNRRGRG